MNQDATLVPTSLEPPRSPNSEGDDPRAAAVDYLFGRLDYERASMVPYSERTLKLARMRELLDRLEQPQIGMPIIHVAGTKGKGSTATMIASILTAARFRTGLFCSPHLDRIEERFCIDGSPCTGEELVRLVDRVRPAVAAMDAAGDDPSTKPTYFELTTAIALLHFASRKVDAAVLEVGLGGRLDSTNVCLPRVCVITSISLDHTQQLGDSLESIAREKAGILKPGVPVISGVCEPEPRTVIEDMARQRGAPLIQLGRDFDYRYTPPERIDGPAVPGCLDYFELLSCRTRTADRRCHNPEKMPLRTAIPTIPDIPIPMPGRHQALNAAVAVAATAEFCRQGWVIGNEAVRSGLASVALPARIEVLRFRPMILVDAAHNVASMQALIETILTTTSARRRILILAATRDKDLQGILKVLLPHFHAIVLTQYLGNPRAVPIDELAHQTEAVRRDLEPPCHLDSVDCCATPCAAWRKASDMASPDDLICVTGSFFIAAEIRRIIQNGIEKRCACQKREDGL